MHSDFELIMISAMYENGGNVTHRLLDGHPQLRVYPFESQLGTHRVLDHLTSLYPAKYRWPGFDLEGDAAGDYREIIDEECRIRIRTPNASKFRDTPIELDDDERGRRFLEHMKGGPRTRGRIVESFFRATFDAWKDRRRGKNERACVGYSPIVAVDAEKILADLPGAHLLHVVRNPWSAYADTKKRPVPLSMSKYMTAWSVCQAHALYARELCPSRVHVLRYEDIIRDPVKILGGLLEGIGLESAPSLEEPTWNGIPMQSVHPWGTIRTPTAEVNLSTAAELSDEERREIRLRTSPWLGPLGYEDFGAR